MEIWLFIFAIVVALSAASNEEEWQNWKLKYGKVYSNEKEEVYRRLIWEKTHNFVRNHNNRSDKQFTVHMNQFADTERRKPSYKHIRPHTDHTNTFTGNLKSGRPSGTLKGGAAKAFDWRHERVIGPVRNEAIIRDPQAIVAAESIASLHAINTGELYEFSAMEITECGCNIKNVTSDIFNCIHTHLPGGICEQDRYLEECQNTGCTHVGKVNGTKYIPFGREDMMMTAMFDSPLMVYVDSSPLSFEFYKNGIYDDPSCNQTKWDQVLQVVGFGEENGKPYWICRNSWGITFGNYGYINIVRNKNMCGIATRAIYPY